MIVFLLMNFIVGVSAFLLNYKLFKFSNFIDTFDGAKPRLLGRDLKAPLSINPEQTSGFPSTSLRMARRMVSLSNHSPRCVEWIDSLISLFILYFAQIVLTELALGIPGVLYLPNVILFNILILLIVWFITRNRRASFNLNGIKEVLAELLKNKVILLAVSVIVAFGLVKICINLVNPPFGWDCLNYHFTFPVEWMKGGHLNNPIVVSDDPFPSYYPINGSLLFLWLIFPFKSAFLADIAQLPFFILAFLAILSISKKLRLGEEYSCLAACLFIAIPNFFKQLQIAYVDMMVAGTFLAAFNFLLDLKEKIRLKGVLIFTLSLGLLIGTKTTALPYSMFLLIPFLCFISFQGRINAHLKLGYLTLSFFIIFIFGSFSYFRNLFLTGNPFYPLDITLLGKTIFKGVIDKAAFTARNITAEYSLSRALFHEGMGIQSLLIILPGTILAPFVNIFRNKNKDLFSSYIMFLPLLFYLNYRFILPIPNLRYLYPMAGIGMIAGFFVLSSLKIPVKLIRVIAVISIIASAFEWARRTELIVALVLSLLLFGFFILCLKYKTLRDIFLSKAVIISSAIIFLIILNWAAQDYKNNEYIRYVKNSRYWPDATKAWMWVNDNTKGNNIAYVGRPVPYPLYGKNLKNNVYYVSVNSIDPIRLHALKNSRYSWDNNAENMHKSFEQPENYRGNAGYLTWLANLRRRNTDFLFIYSLHHTKNIEFPIEEVWAKSHPSEFNLVFNNDTIRVYALNK